MKKSAQFLLTAVASMVVGIGIGWLGHTVSLPSAPIFEFVENVELGGYTLQSVQLNGNTKITIPSEYNREAVVEIAVGRWGTGAEHRNLEEVIIPSNVKVIGNSFVSCISLKEISLPNSVTTIGSNAFEYCENLERVYFGKNVSVLGADTFKNASSIKEFSVHKDNPYFRSLHGNLYSLNGDGELEGLVRYAIGKTETSFALPEGLSQIKQYAFKDCNLQEIILPDSLTDGDFTGCELLTKIDLPKGLKSADFTACKSLTKLELFEGMRSVNFTDCEKLQSVSLPSSLQSLPRFKNCKSLEMVAIPDNITMIPSWSFSGCYSLKNITIPKRITYIGFNAFNGCDALTSVVFENTAYWVAEPTASGDPISFTKAQLSDSQLAASYLKQYLFYEWKQQVE